MTPCTNRERAFASDFQGGVRKSEEGQPPRAESISKPATVELTISSPGLGRCASCREPVDGRRSSSGKVARGTARELETGSAVRFDSGFRGFPGGSSLPRLLSRRAESNIVDNARDMQIRQIIEWADAHYVSPSEPGRTARRARFRTQVV